MNIKKIKSMTCVVLFLIFGLQRVHAQAPTFDEMLNQIDSTAPSSVTTVATVNIYEARVTAQEQNDVDMSFVISNRKGVQPQIMYGILLEKVGVDGNLQVIDEKVYDDVVSLGEGQQVLKEVHYQAPSNLQGSYMIYVEARNKSGFLFSSVPVGTVDLRGDGGGVTLSDCYLTIDKEDGGKKYTANQGVDVSTNEMLVAHCAASSAAEALHPDIETRYRSAFGSVINETKKQSTNITRNGNEISFFITPAAKPQAYEAVVYLANQEGAKLSNTVSFHYVTHGLSASIQDAQFNKDSYDSGNEAAISFFWSPSADSFPDSRIGRTPFDKGFLDLTLVDFKGNVCADKTRIDLSEKNAGYMPSILFKITRPCDHPQLIGKITDASGAVLSEETYDTGQPQGYVQNKDQQENSAQKKALVKILLVACGVVILLLLWYIAKRFKKGAGIGIFFLILFLGATHSAKADTFYTTITLESSDHYINVLYSINLDKSTYVSGERITASGTAFLGACSNGASIATNNTLIATINGYSQQLTINNSLPAYFTAQAAAGSYSASFTGTSKYTYFSGTGAGSIPYSVIPGGQCSSVAGTGYTTAQFDPLKKYGDPNGDGAITSADVTEVTKKVAGQASLCTLATCDVNGDGLINATDVTQINQMSQGTLATKLCSGGIETSITTNATGWNWTCKSITGGTDSNCATPRTDPINGVVDSYVNGGVFDALTFAIFKNYADANADGSITAPPQGMPCSNAYDGCVILQAAVGLGACPLDRCDINGDSIVTAADALLSLKMGLGITPTKLCQAGVETGITTTATGWRWTCKGLYGGTDAIGTATLAQPTAGVCDPTANGKSFSQAQFDPKKIFADADSDGTITKSSAGGTCSTSNNDECISFLAATGFTTSCTVNNCDVDGNGQITTTDSKEIGKMALGVTPTKLCTSGVETSVSYNPGVGWNWTCAGTGGKPSAACSATYSCTSSFSYVCQKADTGRSCDASCSPIISKTASCFKVDSNGCVAPTPVSLDQCTIANGTTCADEVATCKCSSDWKEIAP